MDEKPATQHEQLLVFSTMFRADTHAFALTILECLCPVPSAALGERLKFTPEPLTSWHSERNVLRKKTIQTWDYFDNVVKVPLETLRFKGSSWRDTVFGRVHCVHSCLQAACQAVAAVPALRPSIDQLQAWPSDIQQVNLPGGDQQASPTPWLSSQQRRDGVGPWNACLDVGDAEGPSGCQPL